jgi:hypothetical protein
MAGIRENVDNVEMLPIPMLPIPVVVASNSAPIGNWNWQLATLSQLQHSSLPKRNFQVELVQNLHKLR